MSETRRRGLLLSHPVTTCVQTEPASSGVAAGQQQAATTPEPLVREEQIPKASRLARLLDHNREFVASKKYEDYHSKKAGSSRAVVITCMDSRLIELLPKAMNIRSGEAKIIKTAGAILTHPFGGSLMIRADCHLIAGNPTNPAPHIHSSFHWQPCTLQASCAPC